MSFLTPKEGLEMQYLVLSIKFDVSPPTWNYGLAKDTRFSVSCLQVTYSFQWKLSKTTVWQKLFLWTDEQMNMSRQSVHQRPQPSLSVDFFLSSGSFLSADLTVMTMSIEYKNLFTRCSDAVGKTHNVSAINAGEQSLYCTCFPVQCVTSAWNKQLKKLLDMMQESKGDDFISERSLWKYISVLGVTFRWL